MNHTTIDINNNLLQEDTNFILTQASFNCWLQAVFPWLVEFVWSNLKENTP